MSLKPYTTISEFLGKVDYEGGVLDAVEAGLKSDDLSDEPHHKEFKEDWDKLVEQSNALIGMEADFFAKYDPAEPGL